MIENLRYYINGNSLRVCWNWVDVSTLVNARCRVSKRINGELIEEIDDITLERYRKEKSGCVFTMPQVPAYIEISDDEGRTWKKRDIKEAQPYRITAHCEPYKERLFIKEHYYLKFTVEFSDLLTLSERNRVPGWILCGVLDGKRFFFNSLDSSCSVEVTESEYENAKNIKFEIVPEIEKTRLYHMFCISNDTASTADAETQAQAGTQEVHFDTIKKASDGGFYESHCPYCFEKIDFKQAQFRSKKYVDDSLGYTQEEDKLYNNFCDENKNKYGKPGPLGHVLDWQQDISKIAYFGQPDRFIEYTPDMKITDVVVSVIDQKGNKATQKICPHCHHNIPSLTGKYPMVNIAMMGDSGTGKTVYLAAMIHQLETGAMLPGYNFSLTFCENDRGIEIRKTYDEVIMGLKSNVPEIIQTDVNANIQQSDEAADEAFHSVPTTSSSESDDSRKTPAAETSNSDETSDGFTLDLDDSFETKEAPSSNADDSLGDFSSDTVLTEDTAEQTEVTAEKSAAWEENDSKIEIDLEDLYDDSLTDNGNNVKSSEPKQRGIREATTPDYIDPVIYELMGTDPRTGDKTGVILCFFDFPGEAIREKRSGGNTKHDIYLDRMISEADGLIFLFDPSTLTRVTALQETVRKGLLKNTMGAEAEKAEMITRAAPSTVLREFRTRYIGSMVDKIRKPVTFVISKSDAIRDYLKNADEDLKHIDTFFLDESVYAADSTRTKVHTGEMAYASDAILDFMRDGNLRKLSSEIMMKPEDSIWVCVSSTGIAPDEQGTLYQRYGVPVHVMEPVEWILLRMSMADTSEPDDANTSEPDDTK